MNKNLLDCHSHKENNTKNKVQLLIKSTVSWPKQLHVYIKSLAVFRISNMGSKNFKFNINFDSGIYWIHMIHFSWLSDKKPAILSLSVAFDIKIYNWLARVSERPVTTTVAVHSSQKKCFLAGTFFDYCTRTVILGWYYTGCAICLVSTARSQAEIQYIIID